MASPTPNQKKFHCVIRDNLGGILWSGDQFGASKQHVATKAWFAAAYHKGYINPRTPRSEHNLILYKFKDRYSDYRCYCDEYKGPPPPPPPPPKLVQGTFKFENTIEQIANLISEDINESLRR
jgi:hypothetical protein